MPRAEYDTACGGWPRAEVPVDYRTPARIDTRALVIAGEWDPVTSPRWARAMADQFSQHQLVLIPKEGHIFDDPMRRCIEELTAEFLDRGETSDSCVARHTRPPYALRMP